MKLATSDPERLARFYQDAFGCEVIRPLTKLESPAWRGVGASDSLISILIMSLPGEANMSLELITGTGLGTGSGILTFYVDDLEAAVEKVIAAGGSHRGEVVEFMAAIGSPFRFVFMMDPEGNVVDLFTAAG